MNRGARVLSIDTLERLGAALRCFGEEATVVLADLGMDVHRALQWIEHEQRDYWHDQLRRAEHEVEEARLNLERRRINKVGDQEPSCREEKAALEAAKRKVFRARQKIEAVRRWTRVLEHEFMEYKGGVAPLASWLETDLPKSVAQLRQMGRALQGYVNIEAPAGGEIPAEAMPAEGPGAASAAGSEGATGAEGASGSLPAAVEDKGGQAAHGTRDTYGQMEPDRRENQEP